jgi:hypothetical protein
MPEEVSFLRPGNAEQIEGRCHFRIKLCSEITGDFHLTGGLLTFAAIQVDKVPATLPPVAVATTGRWNGKE